MHSEKPIEGQPDSPSPSEQAKAQEILEACRWCNIDDLRMLALSPGGFLSDQLRQQAWPILLGLPRTSSDPVEGVVGPSGHKHDVTSAGVGSWKELPRHRDEDQVQLDVNRSFIYYPENQSEAELASQRQELSDLIVEVLRRHPWLCYFQGYHDICQVLMLVLPPLSRAPGLARLSALRIRDFMLPKLTASLSQLRLIPDILRAEDPPLWTHLSQTQPFFALSGTLTMYAHDVTSQGAITRLFDALLAREPLFSVYMFAQIVLDRRGELFDTPADEPEMLHSILSKLPPALDLEALLRNTSGLRERHPPASLPAWRSISSFSVLKTAQSAEDCATQSMEVAEVCFVKHARELAKWERREVMRQNALKFLWQYRRPLRGAGLAVLAGLIGVWLSRSPGTVTWISGLCWRLLGGR